ncbi:MAG: hypothetical protein DRQ64_00190 [Gammaproteobacteria bacterium]|nr:MAG: hypothetical protein DRQ64_00190 [Gammaproteobacteria bacterium]
MWAKRIRRAQAWFKEQLAQAQKDARRRRRAQRIIRKVNAYYEVVQNPDPDKAWRRARAMVRHEDRQNDD